MGVPTCIACRPSDINRYHLEGHPFTDLAYNSRCTAAPCEEMGPYSHMHEGNDIWLCQISDMYARGKDRRMDRFEKGEHTAHSIGVKCNQGGA